MSGAIHPFDVVAQESPAIFTLKSSKKRYIVNLKNQKNCKTRKFLTKKRLPIPASGHLITNQI